MVKAHFSKVLALEHASLARVTDQAELAAWRRRLVDELMTPDSPYVLALRPTGDMPDRAAFLDQWRALIAAALDRLPQSHAAKGRNGSSAPSQRRGVDTQETAILVLAALHGGNALSRVEQDPWPLKAALDLALGPFVDHRAGISDDDQGIE
jgi:hypothetical protein